jgi:hypothetical protein
LEEVDGFLPNELSKVIRELDPKSGAARALLDYSNRLSMVA